MIPPVFPGSFRSQASLTRARRARYVANEAASGQKIRQPIGLRAMQRRRPLCLGQQRRNPRYRDVSQNERVPSCRLVLAFDAVLAVLVGFGNASQGANVFAVLGD